MTCVKGINIIYCTFSGKNLPRNFISSAYFSKSDVESQNFAFFKNHSILKDSEVFFEHIYP